MTEVTRRTAIELVGGAALGIGLGGVDLRSHSTTVFRTPTRLRQSVCRWCYADVPLRDFLEQASELGLSAVDLLHPSAWSIVKDYGLTCSTGYAELGTTTDGLNDPKNHDAIVRAAERNLTRAAAAGVRQVIAFVGDRGERSDAEGVANCVAVLERIAPIAESTNVTVVIELLNSKVDHPDYQGDRMSFGVEVVTGVGSTHVKLLYDVYHMQIMEGDVVRTIRKHHPYIAHYQTAGVPGRRELDDRQELNWPAICRAIAETGYRGYLAHEFIPTRDPMTSLRAAIDLCSV